MNALSMNALSMNQFAHLHVASGYSLRHGASTPQALVERAAELGQPALALTDRDGLYGAVRFVRACQRSGVAPILGVDLAVRRPGLRVRQPLGRVPVRRAVPRSTPGTRGSPCSRWAPARSRPRLRPSPRTCPRPGAGPGCAGWSRRPT